MPFSMSRHYGRGYHRRGTPVCQTSFTIDKLFRENSNRPCAARSAGTLGKWGITSFTTIRNSGFDSGRKYSGGHGNQNQNVSRSDNFLPSEGKLKEEVPKPKKFFKSRNTETVTEKTSQASFNVNKQSVSSSYKKNSKKVHEDADSSKKFLTSKNSPESDQSNDEYKPPIVLRIIKGTSCIISETVDSHLSPPRTPTSPRTRSSPSKQEKPLSTRSTRRRSVQDFSEPVPTTPVSPRPKRARKEVIKDPVIQSIISQLISDDEEEGVFEPCEVVKSDASEENNTQTKPSEEEIADEDEVSEDSLPLACTEFYLKKEASANKENEGNENVMKDESNIDEEKLLEVKQLLQETTVDISGAINKIMSPKASPKHEIELPPVVEERESESESDSQEANSLSEVPSCTLMSTVETGGGLKLVIKKTPEIDKELKQCETKSDEVCAPVVKTFPVKKKSIFKSRTKDEGGNGNSKRLALYKHNWNSSQASDIVKQPNPASKSSAYDLNDYELGALTRITTEVSEQNGQTSEEITKVRCDKKDKDYYTVIRNVKKAHQIQESGEFQEFNDDVEYILDALRDNNPVGTRCLSAITLAGKCMAPAFRMHVRAHGTVAKFFKALHDATADPSLGLCTATVMFVLSQDRLNMDLDRDSLELMLNLLESDASHKNALNDCGMSSAQLRKNKQKVRELCAEIKSSGSAKHLNLDNITVGQLAMETLLSLTSKRAGEWFKEELRELGGLEHIVKTICDCSRSLETYISQWTDPLLDKLRKIDRCLRVLENVTNQNEENQIYLLRFQEGILISTMMKLFKICNDEIALYPCTDPSDKVSTGYVIREALLASLKVLINLTQDFDKKVFCENLIQGRIGLVESSLHLLLQVPNYIPDEEKFDLIVLDLSLLINLVEQNLDNRKILMESKAPPDPENIVDRSSRDQMSAVAALVNLFYIHEKSAYEEEVKTDAILDGKKDVGDHEEQQPTSQKSKAEEVEETVAKLLQKAGNHMEHTFIGAYIVLLIGYLIMEDKQHESVVRQFLPDNNFNSFIAVLEKFFNFMKMTASAVGSSQGNKATERVLHYLMEVNKEVKSEEVKDEPKDLSITSLYEGDLDSTLS